VRPLTRGVGLTTDGDQSLCLTVTSPNTIRLLSKPEPRTFTYDHVADMHTTQDSVFSSVAKNIVESCMNGYNGTIFAYGQTGSGKTFTIFLCKCSFIEIYNEQIYDLLDTASASLFLRENIKKGVFVEGAVEKFVNSAAEAYQVLSMGWRNRRVASTSMNRESSRSHAVFTMTLESKESVNEVVNIRMSQLNLVDLAGSERQKDTHTDGSRLKVTSWIQNSPSYLGCFGETLSTLQFAQRAKLIKNKAVINEDTQGNVRQLQAEVKKLKEQLALALTSQPVDYSPSSEMQQHISYKTKFFSVVRLWKRLDEEKKMLLRKVAQLEEAWSQKDKFIHSSRMIVRFREDHIARLEKKLKVGQNSQSENESRALIDQLKKEIKILQDQVEHHPKMTRYAAENYSLRQENRQLRSLEWLMKAEEVSAQIAAELEEAFQKALDSEATERAATFEKVNAKLLQKQSDLTAALQAFEEYKEITEKQMSQLESEKRYLDKSNKHLENILKATNDYKVQEVSELNRIHVETIKILSTPTKVYNLRPRIGPLSSPEHLKETDCAADIWAEQPPADMAEMALTEELRQVQEHASRVQTQLNGEELKNSRLLQQIAKLEEQMVISTQELDTKDEQIAVEKIKRTKDLVAMQETISDLQQSLQSEQQATEVLRTEIRDLRLVLESADKELESVKNELRNNQTEQQSEINQLSSSLISTQLQLDEVKLEWEQLLEQHRILQDSCEQLQAEAKFEADQAKEQLHYKVQEIVKLKAQVMVGQLKIMVCFSPKVELLETVDQNTELRKQVSDLTAQNQQQDVVLDLINQTRDLRNDLSQRDQAITHLTEDLREITSKYNDVCIEREQIKEQNDKMTTDICDLKETLERNVASNKIEVEVLQEEMVYATEEVERLTKVLDDQNSLLKASQDQTAQKDVVILNLQQKVNTVSRSEGYSIKPLEQAQTPTPRTPGSFSRDISQVLESQERELENRRSSMMTMEVLLAELNAERAAKNEEIQRLKMQLMEKDKVRMEIQGLLDGFYNKKIISNFKQVTDCFFVIVVCAVMGRLQAQESMLAQSQTCVQELTSELRNRCLELRDMSLRMQDEERLLQENEVLRKQNIQLSEENGKLVGHKNHKQKIEYLVKLKKDNTKLQEENEKLRTEMNLLRDHAGCPVEMC
uniref:Kinesin motor domain-containing protein n=1 Tax=Gouania willdenowi TaxID=441366 RepID=A0A8C5E1D0_GOUWI